MNDRVAFMKHLFDDNSEDYNRVLSQLITFDTLQEARDFLDNFVKPDYNDWKGKEEYAERFMEIIEKNSPKWENYTSFQRPLAILKI